MDREPPTDEYAAAREQMVARQIRGRGISDPRVLEAMRLIPRDRFVPKDLVQNAYDDGPLAIGGGQTISQPYIVALMSELLELTGSERVLEIGAGSGYQTAILSRLAGEVCALELDEDLYHSARETLASLGITNVDLRPGSGFEAWPDGGSFDAVLSACAPAEVPEVLLDQLKPGGRLVLPVGPAGGVQQLHLLRKGEGGVLSDAGKGGVRFVPMKGSRSLS